MFFVVSSFAKNIPGTSKSKFDNLSKLAKVALCIIQNNAEEEPILSKLRKILTLQRANLEFDSTRASIFNQLNRHHGEWCCQYQSSENVISRSKKVTLFMFFIVLHSSTTNKK